jgi:hypothetical protein
MRTRTSGGVGGAELTSAPTRFVSCAHSDARLAFVAGETTAVNLTVSSVSSGQPYSFGSILLCVSGRVTAIITGVSVTKPQGSIRVETFALRPNPFTRGQQGLGGERSALTVASRDFVPTGQQAVSGQCPSDQSSAAQTDQLGPLSELGVEVSWDGVGQYAGGHGLDVAYTVDGHEQDLIIPFGIWLCAATCPDLLNESQEKSS